MCDAYYISYMDQIVKWDLDKLNTAGFLTEWGALVDSDALDANDANIVGLLADNLVQSWTYWQFKVCVCVYRYTYLYLYIQRDGTVAEGLNTYTHTHAHTQSFNDPTTQAMQRDGTVAEGLYDPWTGELLDSKVALLTRTYPTSVAGAIRCLNPKP